MKISYTLTGQSVTWHPVSHRFFKSISTKGVNGWKKIVYDAIHNTRENSIINMAKMLNIAHKKFKR